MVAEGDRQTLEGERERAKEMGEETGGVAQPKEEEEEEEEQEEGQEENAPFKPFVMPGEWWRQADAHTKAEWGFNWLTLECILGKFIFLLLHCKSN